MERVCFYNSYFVQKVNLSRVSPHQKINANLQMCFFSNLCVDAIDEYCRITESTTMKSLKKICVVIRTELDWSYLCQITWADFEKKLAINSAYGFLGKFESFEHMHYEWKFALLLGKGTLEIGLARKQSFFGLVLVKICTRNLPRLIII